MVKSAHLNLSFCRVVVAVDDHDGLRRRDNRPNRRAWRDRRSRSNQGAGQ